MFAKSLYGIDGRRLPTDATFARCGRGFRDASGFFLIAARFCIACHGTP